MDRHGTIREGVIAGVLGATGVAAWFLIVDTIAGQPFFTPRVLGEAVKSIVAPDSFASPAVVVALYTVFHYAVFIIAGIAIIALVHGSARHIGLLTGLAILFVVLEVGYYFFVLFLQQATRLDNIAWYQVGAANLVAAALMGRYLWLKHPELTHRLNESLSGRP
ncbi:MAG TPA: hypothetical protein VFD64_20685 [Gemmatimonadaceae bacterium]|nr:hypothetical protein [Gemmatimonadaceae bacterium]